MGDGKPAEAAEPGVGEAVKRGVEATTGVVGALAVYLTGGAANNG